MSVLQEFRHLTWQGTTFYDSLMAWIIAQVCHRQRCSGWGVGDLGWCVPCWKSHELEGGTRSLWRCKAVVFWMIIWHCIQYMNTYMISDILQVEEMTKKLVPGKLQIDGHFQRRCRWQSSHHLSYHSPLYFALTSDLLGIGVSGLIMYLNKSWLSTDLIDSYWSMFDKVLLGANKDTNCKVGILLYVNWIYDI